MIIVSLTGPSLHDVLRQIAVSAPFADMFEFRLDLISRPNISRLLDETLSYRTGRGMRTIATCRPVWEGGGFSGNEADRIEILESASLLGVDFIDIELQSGRAILAEFLRRQKETKVIVSLHLGGPTKINIAGVYAKMHATGAEVVKLAYMAHDSSDNRHAFEFLSLARADRRKAIAIAMGEFGEPSRILYKKFGGWGTYAATEDGMGAAPGQIPASHLKKVYRADRLNATTKVYGVIGNPVRQSKGIYIHNPLLKRARKNAVYCRFPVNNLGRFITHIAPLLQGFSVTMPFKKDVLRYLDGVEQSAKKIGAVNTILRRRGKLLGTNTDGPGALDAIESVVRVRKKTMLIVGAGGAARAIAYEAKRRGAEVLITNRTEKKAQLLSRRFGLTHLPIAQIGITPFDILVNATSVGMAPRIDETPVPKEILKNKVVFDAVYNPQVTRLLREATEMGAEIIQGTEMYLNQAARQFRLYTGIKPKIRAMRKFFDEQPEKRPHGNPLSVNSWAVRT